MKAIFTKLSVLILCGAFAVVSCTDFSADLKEYNDRLTATENAVAANSQDIADLKTAIAALQKEVDEKYATIAQFNELQLAIEKLQKELEKKLDEKATPADIQNAVDDLTDVINGLDEKYHSKEYIADLKEDLEEKIAAVPQYDDQEVRGLISGLDSRVAALENYKKDELAPALEDVKTRLANVEADLLKLKNLPEEMKEVQKQLININATLAEKADLAALAAKADKTALDAVEEELKKKDVELDGQITDLDKALKAIDEAYKKADQALQDAIDALEERVTNLEKALKALEEKEDNRVDNDTKYDAQITELYSAIGGMSNTYDDVVKRLEALEEKVEVLETALRSIVSVPQLLVNGVPSVEFQYLTYVPVGKTTPVVKYYEAEVYYLFNPSNFNLKAADYAIVSENVEVRTKSAAGQPVSIVAKEAVNKEGKVKFTLSRTQGTDNMFALAATLKADESVIYSDYIQVVETELTVEDFVLVDETGAELVDYDVTVNLANVSDLAEYVDVLGLDADAYGLGYNFVVEEGNLVLDGSKVVAEESGRGYSKVRVELVDLATGDVLSCGYLHITVVGPVTYYSATVEASVESSRLTFELTEEVLREWAQDIKDQPNTTELVADAVTAILDGNYLTALNYLGGVPGFKTITTTFTGKGEAKVKVLDSFEAAEDSLLEEVEAISSVSDLIVIINKLSMKHDDAVINKIFSELDLVDYIPATTITYYLEKIPYIGESLAIEFNKSLEDFKGLDGTTLLNLLQSDLVATALDLVFSYVANIEDDYDPYGKMKEALANVVKDLEGAGSLATNPEEYAYYSAVEGAKKMARDEVNDAFNAANEAIKENLENGPWGIAKKVLESEIADKVCEEFGITSEQQTILLALDTILYKAQYDQLDLLNIKYTPNPVVATPSTVIE